MGRFGRPTGRLLRILSLPAPSRALRRTENPRVGGSIPPLATTPNSMKRIGFPESPADYRRPQVSKSDRPSDFRILGRSRRTRVDSRHRGEPPRHARRAPGVAARGALGGAGMAAPMGPARASLGATPVHVRIGWRRALQEPWRLRASVFFPSAIAKALIERPHPTSLTVRRAERNSR